MDHVTSVAENVRDPAMNAHLTKDEQIAWVNSKDNLQPLDAAANASKGDSTTSEWLDSERDGKKPAERFNIDEEQLRKNDKKARNSRKKRIKEGEERSIASGKKTQRDEAVRIGGKALRAAAMALLAELAKTIIGKLVQWMKSAKKNLTTFVEQIKAAVQAFLGNLKSHLQTAGTSAGSAVLTAIVGPIASLLQKTWVLLKQGAKSVKEAIAYIKAPENRRKSFGVLMLEVGKIVTAGVSAMGAVVLGEVITKSLMAFPIFMIELPLIGSLASVIGIFLGAIISGILGALVLNLLNKIIAKKKKREIIGHEIDKGNEILAKQAQAMTMAEMRVAKTKRGSEATIHQRHEDAAKQIEDALGMICLENHTDNREKLDDIQDMLESF